MTVPPSPERPARLNRLRLLLTQLPNVLPHPDEKSSQFGSRFLSFQIDAEAVTDYGTEGCVINRELEIAFGAKTRADHGYAPILERGKYVCAIADVLDRWASVSKKEDEGMLDKWIDDVTLGAEKAYAIAKISCPANEDAFSKKRRIDKPASGSRKAKKAREPTVIDIHDDSEPGSGSDESTPNNKHRPKGVVRVEDLIDMTPVPKALGRHHDPVIDLFAIRCKHRVNNKPYFRCRAPGCRHVRSGTGQTDRVLAHARHCNKLSKELKKRANDYSAERAPSNQIDSSPSEQVPTEVKSKDKSAGFQSTLKNLTEATGRTKLEHLLNYDIVQLICVRGMVPSMVDSEEWKTFVGHATGHHYKCPASTKFSEDLIPAEAAKVRVLQLDHLKTLGNLTLTFDGNTIRRPQSVYTLTVTTPDRATYLIDGHEGSRDKHTSEYNATLVEEVLSSIGPHRFSAICSDNASNVAGARRIISKKYPFIINLIDAPHHLNNTLKDITSLPEFETVIAPLRRSLKYFKKSTFASTELEVLRKANGVGRGLEGIGKTRFATLYYAASSMERCLPQIRALSSEQGLKIKGFDTSIFAERSAATHKFAAELSRYNLIAAPIAHAIKCLESSDATAGDVYIFWLAIAATLRTIFDQGETETGISKDLEEKITLVINKRYKQFIDDGPSDVYFTAFFLDSRYARSDILRKPTTVSKTVRVPSSRAQANHSATSDDSDGTPFPSAYRRAKEFLKKLLKAEVEKSSDERHPHITSLGKQRAVEEFRRQLLAYARGEWPFNVVRAASERPLDWWRTFEEDPRAHILAMLAIKIYSIGINSMADERTMSTFTWFNSKLRNRQHAATLVDMVQVRQWKLLHPSDTSTVKPSTHPTVRWIDVEKVIFRAPAHTEKKPSSDTTVDQDDTQEHDSIEDSDDSDSEDEDTPLTSAMASLALDDDVDLTSRALADLLTEKSAAESVPQGAQLAANSNAQPEDSADVVDWDSW